MAVKWYRPSASRSFDTKVQSDLVKLVDGGRPKNHAFIWPIDMVSSPGQDGFGYVMPRMENRFITCFQMLSNDRPPSFDIKIRSDLT